jgi:predicted ferric reductase
MRQSVVSKVDAAKNAMGASLLTTITVSTRMGGTDEPGQYFFLNCPYVALFQWHPFSVVSSTTGVDGNTTIEFSIKGLGPWSEAVAGMDLVAKKMFIDGPYGALSVQPARCVSAG